MSPSKTMESSTLKFLSKAYLKIRIFRAMLLLQYFQYKWRVFVATKKILIAEIVKFNVLNRDFLQMYKRKQI